MQLVRQIQKPVFEKVAAKILLGNDISAYPSELINALYRQHPFMANYRIDTVIKGQEPNAGYMYGAFLVRPQATSPDMLAEQGTSVRVPVIVQARKAYSFDVLIDPAGKFHPMSEARLSKILFDPTPAAAVSPQTVNNGGNSQAIQAEATANFSPEMSGATERGKFSSALETILPNTPAEVVNAFVAFLEGSQISQDYIATSPAFADAVERVLSVQGQLPFRKEAAVASEYEDLVTAPVVVLTKTASGYMTYYATYGRGGEALRTLPLTKAAAEGLPLEYRQRALDNGFAVLTTPGTVALPLVDAREGLYKTASAEVSGFYAVTDAVGTASRAAVFAKVARLDGTSVDMKLVFGEAGARYQDKVAGILCGSIDTGALIQVAPVGTGFFVLPDGTVTELVHARTTVDCGDGLLNILCDTANGAQTIKLASVHKPARCSNTEILFPDSALFVAAVEAKADYTSGAGMTTKLAAADSVHKAASLEYDQEGAEYVIGIPGYNSEIKTREAHVAAVLLGLQGDSPTGIYEKLAAARAGAKLLFTPQPVCFVQPDRTPDFCKEAAQEISASLRGLDLIKIAAALQDPNSVDAVLSLNFVTDENMLNFVNLTPKLEEVVSSLAQMLVAARLGAPDIQEQAVGQALVATEKVILGLKRLHIRLSLTPMGADAQG